MISTSFDYIYNKRFCLPINHEISNGDISKNLNVLKHNHACVVLYKHRCYEKQE